MDDLQAAAIERALADAIGVVMDIIGGVVLACMAKDAIDIAKLREALDHVAANPGATRMERAMVERLLGLVGKDLANAS